MPTIISGDGTITGLTATGISAAQQLPVGSVLQVVNVQTGSFTSTTSQIPNDNTIPQNTEGTELFTVSITPNKTTSKLLIQAIVQCTTSTNAWGAIAVFQDSTANAIAATTAYITTGTGGICLALNYYMTSGTTSSTTFKLRYGPNGNTMYVNGSNNAIFNGVLISSMTVTEIS
jgi:hypothetical protein